MNYFPCLMKNIVPELFQKGVKQIFFYYIHILDFISSTKAKQELKCCTVNENIVLLNKPIIKNIVTT